MSEVRRSFVSVLETLSRRRLAVGAIGGVVVLLAAVALSQMPLQLLPEIRYPQVRIISDIPGQTSGVIEESVNEPIEAALTGVPGIVQLESRSGDGRSYLDLFFPPGYDLDRALRDVTQAVQRAQAQIPPDFPEPRIFAVSTLENPSLEFAFGSSTLPVDEIRQRLRGTVVPRLRALDGVEAVYVGREEIPELVVEVDPLRQVASGVTLEALESVLLQATEPLPASAMRTPTFEGMAVLGEAGWSPERIAARPVAVDGSGMAVPVGSFASVFRARSEESLRTRLNREAAVLVSVHRSSRAHATRLADAAREIVSEVAASPALQEIEAHLLFDDSVVTRSAVRSVVVAAVGGAFLAILLLFFMLRQRRSTPLVAAVVGVSLAAAVVVLHATGVSLNLLTLAGLLLSVGLGLDYAIIYLDRLDRLGASRPAPHLEAMADVVGPLLGALLTTLAAVLPFLLVEGMVALLFRPLIWTVAVAAVFSFLFAVLLLPVFSRVRDGRDTADADGRDPATWAGQDPGHNARHRSEGVARPHPRDPRAPSRWDLTRRPWITWGIVTITLLGIMVGGRALPFQVLPVVDDGFVEARLTHPAGISQGEMDVLARRAEAALVDVPGTAALFTTVGGYFREGLPAFRPGTTDFMVRVDTGSEIGSSQEWTDQARRALQELDVPGLGISLTPPRIRGVQTRLSDADLVVVLTRADGDLLALTEVESTVIETLRGVRGLTDVQRVRAGVSPRWRGEPDYERLAALGITQEVLARTLAYGLEGRVLRQRMWNGEPLALRTRYDRRNAGGPHHLDGIRLAAAGGAYVGLGGMVTFRLVEEPTHIERREGQRVVRVSAQLDPSGPGPSAVGRAVEQALAGAGLPGEIRWWLEGELDALEETRTTFGRSMLLALVLVLALLIAQYGSVSFALAGLLSIPLSGIGALGLLGLLGRPLDAMVLAGLLIAVGIVANNVILVLSQARAASLRDPYVSPEEALREAARDRLRPITLTVLSTVLGMSPLLFGGAEVFGLLQPLAIALTGALLVSIPLACVLLPGMAASLVRAGDRITARVRTSSPG
jgi:multidrug efflux pump subunit AcrB